MHHSVGPFSLLATFAAPLLLAEPEVELTFQPEEGVTVALVFHEVADGVTLEESWVTINAGERVEEESGSTDDGATWSFELTGELVDVHDSVDDGRVTGLTRTFEELDGTRIATLETDEGIEEFEEALTTPLLGRTVTFEWDEDGEDYEVALDDGGDDEEVDGILVGGMKIDAFGAWFLPEDAEVEVGDEWDAGAEAWCAFSEYGGDFWVDVEDADPPSRGEAETARSIGEQLRESAEGEVLCTFEGFEEVDGVELAVVSISIEIAQSYEVESDFGDEEDGDSVNVVEEVETETSGEGRCLWNSEAHRPHSITLQLEMNDTTVSTEMLEVDGESYGLETTTATRTNTTMTYRFEVR